MSNRILDCIISLCNALISGRGTSSDIKLVGMEQRLTSMERELSSINTKLDEIRHKIGAGQSIAWFHFGYSTGLAAMIVGATLAVADTDRFWSWIALFIIGAVFSIASVVKFSCKRK